MPLLIIALKTTNLGINIAEDRQVFCGTFLIFFYFKIFMKIKTIQMSTVLKGGKMQFHRDANPSEFNLQIEYPVNFPEFAFLYVEHA